MSPGWVSRSEFGGQKHRRSPVSAVDGVNRRRPLMRGAGVSGRRQSREAQAGRLLGYGVLNGLGHPKE
jgi:hypothetical protein